MSNANVMLIQDLYAAFGRGDIATIIDWATPDVEWEIVGRRTDFRDPWPAQREGWVAEFFGLLAQHLDFAEFSPKEFFATNNMVFVLGHYAMTVKDRPPGQERLDSSFHHRRRQGREIPRIFGHGPLHRSLSRVISRVFARAKYQVAKKGNRHSGARRKARARNPRFVGAAVWFSGFASGARAPE